MLELVTFLWLERGQRVDALGESLHHSFPRFESEETRPSDVRLQRLGHLGEA